MLFGQDHRSGSAHDDGTVHQECDPGKEHDRGKASADDEPRCLVVFFIDQHHGGNDQYRRRAGKEQIRAHQLDHVDVVEVCAFSGSDHLSEISENYGDKVISEMKDHREQDVVLFDHEI